MRKTRAATQLVFALFLLLSAASFGCSRNNMDYGPMLASAETRGEQVYERNCSPCHEAQNLQLLKQPPKLGGLFRHRTLSSGAPATDEEVRKTIVGGRGIMPPFERTLDERQIDDLLKYLHKL